MISDMSNLDKWDSVGGDILRVRYRLLNEDDSSDWVWCIDHQDEEVLKRGEFSDIEWKVVSSRYPRYDSELNMLYILGEDSGLDSLTIVVSADSMSKIITKVDSINNKYKKKLWRAEYGKYFYYINDQSEVRSRIDQRSGHDEYLYQLGNYFKTANEARKHLRRCIRSRY